jgi:murein endopeptidase
MASCAGQSPPPAGDGCGAELTEWFKPKPPPKKPTKPVKPVKPPPPLTLTGLPKACTDVLYARDAAILAGGASGDDPLGKLIGRDETGASIKK